MSVPEPDAPIGPLPKSPDSRPTEGVPRQPAPHEAGVPRRFGVGILLVITSMYTVLFAVLRALGVPPIEFILVALFFTAVGLGQMLLYQGKRPRRASVMAGAGCGVGLCVLGAALGHDHLRFAPFDPIGGAIAGAVYGYPAGVLIAGVFLLIEKVRRLRGRRNRTAAPTSPGPEAVSRCDDL
jgi:hypothetical protein